MLEFARGEQPDDPFSFRFGPQTYTLRGEGGGVDVIRLEWSESLLADLAALARPRCDPAIVQRVGDSLREALRDGGWERHEQALGAAVARGDGVKVVVRSAAAELYALPWELMTVGASGRYLAELPRTLCVYTWPESHTADESPSPRPEGGRILCAWSAAGGAVPAGEHVRAIAEAAREGVAAFDAATDVIAHASLGAIALALAEANREGRPFAALHLLCHGGRCGETVGLWLDGDAGGDRVAADAGDLRLVLAPYAATLRFVVLAACGGSDPGELGNHLGSAAQALHRAGLAAVVASRFPLSVPGSLVLARTLYRTLMVELGSVEQGVLAARDDLSRDPERLDWASLQLYARPEEGDTRPLVVRPYRGLLAFEAKHHRLFFGREAKIDEIVGDLAASRDGGRPRFLVVAGASGTGKSSLVLAGAAPRLLAADPRLQLVTMRPGGAPLEILSEHLASRADPTRPLLLVVDQFEELFTHDSAPAARLAFTRALWRLAADPRGTASVIVTLRVDFIGACSELEVDANGLRLDQVSCDRGHGVLVAQMGPDELRAAIERPAAAVGLSFEAGLVGRICAELGDSPGALPLLADTLDQLWERRRGRTLTQDAYDALGGVAGALERRAEAFLSELDATDRQVARRILLRLVTLGRDGAAVRQRLRVDVLRPADPALARRTDAIVDRLVRVRLAIHGEERGAPTLEIAHEALIRRWPRLQTWLREDTETLAALAELSKWVQTWKSHGTLLVGHQLGYAAALAERHAHDIDADTRALIDASLRRSELRRVRRRRAFVGAVAAAVCLAIFGAAAMVFAVDARRAQARADEGARAADDAARRARDAALLAAARANLDDTRFAALLLREVQDPTIRGFLATAAAIFDEGAPPEALRGHTARIRAVGFSADGAWIATASDDGTARVSPSAGGEAVVLQHPSSVVAVALNGDGSRIVTAAGDGVRLWRRDAPRAPLPLRGAPPEPSRVAFSPDGSRIVATGAYAPTVWRGDGSGDPQRLDCGDAGLLGGGRSVGLAWSPDGRSVAASCGLDTVRVWRLDSGAATRLSIVGTLRALAWSPDGARVLTVTDREGVAVHRVDDGTKSEPDWGVVAAVFADDGSLVTARMGDRWRDSGGVAFAEVHPASRATLLVSEAGELALQDTELLRVQRLRGPPTILPLNIEYPLLPAAWSPDGRRIAVAGRDHALRIWTVGGTVDPPIWGGPDDPVRDGVFRPGADEVLLLSRSGAALESVTGERPSVRFVAGEASFTAAAWNADGSRLALLTTTGSVRIVDPALGTTLAERGLGVATDKRAVLAYSPDGVHLMAWPGDDSALVWKADAQDEPRRLACTEARVHCGAWSPDGAAIALGCSDGTVAVHALAADRAPRVLAARDGPVFDLAWSPDGQRLAAAHADGVARVWRSDGAGEPLVLPGQGTQRSIDWSSDGAHLVTTSQDRLVRVWSAVDGALLRLFEGHDQELARARFSPDGHRVLTHASDGTARVWSTAGVDDPAVFHGARVPFSEYPGSARWSGDGRRVLLVGEARARVVPVAPALLQAWLKKHVRECMSSTTRVSLLGDAPAAAAVATAACELERAAE